MSKDSKSGTSSPLPPEAQVGEFELGDLHLDLENPRFGGVHSRKMSEPELVNVIAEEHDLTDVLSSISANGYFPSEPLIGARNKRKEGGVTILEGNRRLAACMILAGDSRAADQTHRRELYLPSRFSASDRLPVVVYDWHNEDHRRQLLPYLGIKHLVGPLPWDSFAKAAWVSAALEQKFLNLDQIMKMVGDKNRTMPRLLDGYYFVRQVEQTRSYDPQASTRRGRGSKPEYPFSWVYNALDYDNVRDFVGLGSRADLPRPDPIPKAHLEHSGELMRWMFGDRKAKIAPAITDSREIQGLAQALSQKPSLRELRKGYRLTEALNSALPGRERALRSLEDATDLAIRALSLLPDLSADEAEELIAPADRLVKAARTVRDGLRRVDDADEGVVSNARK